MEVTTCRVHEPRDIAEKELTEHETMGIIRGLILSSGDLTVAPVLTYVVLNDLQLRGCGAVIRGLERTHDESRFSSYRDRPRVSGLFSIQTMALGHPLSPDERVAVPKTSRWMQMVP